MHIRTCLAALLILSAARTGAQSVDTIGWGHTTLSTKYLRPGLHQYFIYMQDTSSKQTLTFWYWLRRVDRETVNGEPTFRIAQH